MSVDVSLTVAPWIEASRHQHIELLGARLTRIRLLACEAVEGNPGAADLAMIDRQVAMFCNDLRECCGREETMVFPALLRLREQTRISSCKAGMIKARLRFMTAEQTAVAAALRDIIAAARAHLSPGGPCELCHELLRACDALRVELEDHLRREQEELFAWAVAREEQLARSVAP
jgi:iron-sulfur cluster repair protein YtfE (RIC family)